LEGAKRALSNFSSKISEMRKPKRDPISISNSDENIKQSTEIKKITEFSHSFMGNGGFHEQLTHVLHGRDLRDMGKEIYKIKIDVGRIWGRNDIFDFCDQG